MSILWVNKGQGQRSRSKVKVTFKIKVIFTVLFLCVTRSVRPRSRAVKVECQGHFQVKGQGGFKVIVILVIDGLGGRFPF